jgi:hypothetical protein
MRAVQEAIARVLNTIATSVLNGRIPASAVQGACGALGNPERFALVRAVRACWL